MPIYHELTSLTFKDLIHYRVSPLLDLHRKTTCLNDKLRRKLCSESSTTWWLRLWVLLIEEVTWRCGMDRT